MLAGRDGYELEDGEILLDIEMQSERDKTLGIIKAGIFPVTKSSYEGVLSRI